LGRCSARNTFNQLVRAYYANVPIRANVSDKDNFELIINEVQKVTHNMMKYMSNVPDVQIPLPYENKTQEVAGKIKKREQIVEEWLKNIRFDYKYKVISRNLSLFGYQPVRLFLDAELNTKLQLITDPLDTTVGEFKIGYEPELSYYGTKLMMTGAQIHEQFLDGSNKNGITPQDKARAVDKRRKSQIRDDYNEEYEIIISITDQDMYIIAKEAEVILNHIEHHRGFVPAIFYYNIINPGNPEGISDSAHILGKMEYRNMLMAYAIEYLGYKMNPLMLTYGLSPDDQTQKQLTERRGHIAADVPEADAKFISTPDVSRELETVNQSITNAINDESSLNDIASSGRTGDLSRIDAATVIGGLNIGLDAHLHMKQGAFCDINDILIGYYLQWIDEVYRPELFGEDANIMAGSKDPNTALNFNGADINGNYFVNTIFLEGTFDLAQRKQIYLREVEAGLRSKKSYRQATNMPRSDAEEAQIQREKEQEIKNEGLLAQAQGKAEAPPQGMGQPPMGQEMGLPPGGPPMGPEGGMPPDMMGGMPPEQGMLPGMEGGMPPEMGGEMGGMSPDMGMEAPIAPELSGEGVLNEQEIIQAIDSLSGLKGTAEFQGIDGDQIIIAISDNIDKKTILDQLPEYKGQIKFVFYDGLKELQGETPQPELNPGMPPDMGMGGVPPMGGMGGMEGLGGMM